MALQLKLPDIGENIEDGEVVRVLVQVGDTLVKDQGVIELETGKATVEVPAAAAGKVTAVHVKEGETLKVGAPMVTIDEAGQAEPVAPARAAEPAAAEPPPPAPEQKVAPAPAAPAAPAAARAAEAAEPPPPAAVPAPSGEAVAAPHVRQFAREIAVDLQQVRGSGPGGRISVEDVKRHAREAGPAGGGAAAPKVRLPDFSRYGEVERKPLSNIRRITAQQMNLAWSSIPHVMLEQKADITELEEFRQKYRKRAEQAGGKMTVTALMVKVAASALRAFPNVNASLDLARSELVLKKYVNVGVAVDTPRGLLVPVIRDADQKQLVPISVELTQLAEKARDGKLAPTDLEGGSFSITNLGGMGIGHFTAIINHPDIAILAVGKAQLEPVWIEGQFKPRLMLPLSLSVDHRVLDGADGARFLSWIVDAIEQPFLLALEG